MNEKFCGKEGRTQVPGRKRSESLRVGGLRDSSRSSVTEKKEEEDCVLPSTGEWGGKGAIAGAVYEKSSRSWLVTGD